MTATQTDEADSSALKRIPIPFADALLKEIDDFRFEARMPSRAEAIRILIREALDARKRKAG